jgi:hypothetical protein
VEPAETFTFEQWVLFLAISFRDRYRGRAAERYAEVAHRLPLIKGGKLTVVQVNSGEAVHFVYHPTPAAEATDCRHLTVQPPDGLTLRDWAMVHEEGYKRFVERTLARGAAVGHFVVFPSDDSGHMQALEAAELCVRAHAAALR